MDHFLAIFTQFLIAIDPLGTIPVLLWIAAGYQFKQKILIAGKASLFAGFILFLFLFFGNNLLAFMEVHVGEFMIAGGIVLFLFSCDMIFGLSKPEKEIDLAKKTSDIAIFPLAIPSIASPAALIQTVIVVESERLVWHDILIPTFALLAALVATVLILILGLISSLRVPVFVLNAASRLMGLLLAALAVKYILAGYRSLPIIS